MKIVSRFDGRTLYESDADSMLKVLQEAVKAGADISRADLSRANLYGADLYGANLSGADISGADLSRANLSNANISGADLYGADLYGHKITGLPIVAGYIGSRQTITMFWPTDDGVFVQCGCYFGSLAEFAERVKQQHGDNQYGREYAAAIAFAEASFAARKPATKEGVSDE